MCWSVFVAGGVPNLEIKIKVIVGGVSQLNAVEKRQMLCISKGTKLIWSSTVK